MTAYLALFITILLTVSGQVLQKQVADAFALQEHTEQPPLRFPFYLRQPSFWSALLCLGLALLAWLVVLRHMDVSRAYALLSINYPLMLVVAHFGFGEVIPLRRWLGVCVVCMGLVLVFLK